MIKEFFEEKGGWSLSIEVRRKEVEMNSKMQYQRDQPWTVWEEVVYRG